MLCTRGFESHPRRETVFLFFFIFSVVCSSLYFSLCHLFLFRCKNKLFTLSKLKGKQNRKYFREEFRFQSSRARNDGPPLLENKMACRNTRVFCVSPGIFQVIMPRNYMPLLTSIINYWKGIYRVASTSSFFTSTRELQ